MALRPVVGALRHGEQTDHLHNTAAGRLSGVCLSFYIITVDLTQLCVYACEDNRFIVKEKKRNFSNVT